MKKNFIPVIISIAVLCGCNNGENLSPSTEGSSEASTDHSDFYGETYEALTPAPPAEVFPFPGMELTGETLTVGNLPANVKEVGTNAFFCCDENGEIYYANLADNASLYHLNSGGAEKLADKPACWITAVGDDIFFISPKETITSEIGDSAPTGTVYRYSKTEKRCEIYLDENNISTLYATADGLYYRAEEKKTDLGNGESVTETAEYFRRFQSDTSEKQPMNYWLETCGYHLEHSEERNTFFMTNGNASADIAADDTMLFVNGCIVDKKIYAFFRKTFRILDLQTGGMRVYTADNFASLLGSAISEISGYTVLDGCAYLCFGSYFIVKIDENGELYSFSCIDSSVSLRQMYTDGSSLYGFTGDDIVKIIFTDDENIFIDDEIIITGYDMFSVLSLGATE